MKRIFTLFLFAFLALTVSGQGLRGINRPVKDHPYFNTPAQERTADRSAGIWLVRFGAGIQGNLTLYNKVTKSLELTDYIKTGFGISWAHYRESTDGSPYNDFSINGLILKNISDPSISFALTVSAFQFVQVGIDINPSLFKSDYFPIAPTFGLKYSF